MSSLSRRQLLFGLAATPVLLSLGCSRTAVAQRSTRPLPIPPLAEGMLGSDGVRTFTLKAITGETEMLPGVRTATWGFNGPVLGPTLRARRGERGGGAGRERIGRTDHGALARNARARPM